MKMSNCRGALRAPHPADKLCLLCKPQANLCNILVHFQSFFIFSVDMSVYIIIDSL